MTLSIYSNLLAVNSARTLGNHYSRLATSIQRLSSGLRINSAADDAAGLAIRELMRADIATYRQGIRNVNDAISLIQTADGALSVIDEKLIRMKELAEQAATGTYTSDQRLLIDAEFQAMGAEIDRIARATDFNGIKLLDGSLSGTHDGEGLTSTGAMKIHFGPGNDSAEDYYYIDIGDCTCAGLGLRETAIVNVVPPISKKGKLLKTAISINDIPQEYIKDETLAPWVFYPGTVSAPGQITTIDNMNISQGEWYKQGTVNDHITPWTPWDISPESNFGFIIPKGTKNIVINISGVSGQSKTGDNDIELFTLDGVHLAGTPGDDYVFKGGVSRGSHSGEKPTDPPIKGWLKDLGKGGTLERLPFTYAEYDDSQLNTGPAKYDPTGVMLQYSTYNGMTIGYSGDPDRYETPPNDGANQMAGPDYEVLTIDEATEDLIFLAPGMVHGFFKAYWMPATNQPNSPQGELISIATQEKAQRALERIDAAIVQKDKVRAHLGALQNRFENTITNLSVQAENLQAAESRISDTDVAVEMTEFVRNQILSQSATAMLAQANSLPQMLVGLLEG